MNKSLFVFLAYLLLNVGCSSIKHGSKNGIVSAENHTQLPSTNKKTEIELRLANVKKQLTSQGINTSLLIEADDLYKVMLLIQEGVLATENLKGAHLFFKDSTGIDYGLGIGRFFSCVEVTDITNKLPISGNTPIFKALYSNPLINISVSVISMGPRPLEGQKLNVDYLEIGGVDSYESRGGGKRAEVIFIKPQWFKK